MLIPLKTSRRGVIASVIQKSADSRVAKLEFAQQLDFHYAVISI